MYCSNCGSEITAENAAECMNCGLKLKKSGIGKGLIIAGYITMIFPPIVGFIIGIIILAKGDKVQKKHGIAITIVSVINMIIGVAMKVGT